ncbi:MAG: hypothetical protein FWF84_03190 [Kiritimatiellaeota bacterium]|nr:hypothetical protein [Kiritimatiellota bacterium]
MIKKIIDSSFFPLYEGGDVGAWQRRVEAHAEKLKRKGVTHVMINEAVGSLIWAMEPENSYLRYTNARHTFDKYVTSSWNVGIYSEELLSANRKILLQHAELVRRHGFRCAVSCIEMGIMPESFFLRHPALRGPRVDNPVCSRIPHYALCAMLPEVQDHYRQLTRKMLALVPDLDVMTIFTNDSGAGFCYSSHLYAGANGPVHCKDIPSHVQARTFCSVIGEAGRESNPAFEVIMTSGMSPKEKALFIEGAPPCVSSDVYGALAWGAGLEDQWINMEMGPCVYGNPVERAKGRKWAWEDYAARVAPIRKNGGTLYASYAFGYYLSEMRPHECYDIMTKLTELGVDGLLGGASGETPYSANNAVIKRVMDKGIEGEEKAIRAIAEEWVGAKEADTLCQGWKLADHAEREWPMPASGGHFLRMQPLPRCMPVVPDEEKLGEHDLDYFMTPVIRDEQAMKSQQGGLWRFYYYTQADIEAYIKQYETVTFPEIEKAMALFADGMKRTTGAAFDCFKEQRDTLGWSLVAHKRLYYGLMAAMHRIAQYTQPAWLPPFAQIVEREIALYEEALQNGWHYPMEERIALMRKHKGDPVKKIDLSEFVPHLHLGLNDAASAAHIK